jgi:hypothetical protein
MLLIFVGMAIITVKVEIALEDGSTVEEKTILEDVDLDGDIIIESEIVGTANGGPFPRPAKPRAI